MAVGEYETGYSIYGKGTLITVGRFTGVLFHILRTVVRASTMGDTSMPMLPSQRHRDRDTGTQGLVHLGSRMIWKEIRGALE